MIPPRKRGRPRKIIEAPPRRIVTEDLEDIVVVNPNDEITIGGIAPGRIDVEEEFEALGGRGVDPYYEESARFGRNGDDPMGGVGLNFGDW